MNALHLVGAAADSTVKAAQRPLVSLTMVIAVGMILAMLSGIWIVFARLRDKQQGFGPNSLKALGLVIFLPSLVLVAIQSPDFSGSTLSALLGTVAGYVLSHSKAEDA